MEMKEPEPERASPGTLFPVPSLATACAMPSTHDPRISLSGDEIPLICGSVYDTGRIAERQATFIYFR